MDEETKDYLDQKFENVEQKNSAAREEAAQRLKRIKLWVNLAAVFLALLVVGELIYLYFRLHW